MCKVHSLCVRFWLLGTVAGKAGRVSLLGAPSLPQHIAPAVPHASAPPAVIRPRAWSVCAVPGYHLGSAEMLKWGHPRLRALLNREPPFPPAFKGAPLVAQYSSMGSVDEAWLTGEFRESLAAGRCGDGGGESVRFDRARVNPMFVWRSASRQLGMHRQLLDRASLAHNDTWLMWLLPATCRAAGHAAHRSLGAASGVAHGGGSA